MDFQYVIIFALACLLALSFEDIADRQWPSYKAWRKENPFWGFFASAPFFFAGAYVATSLVESFGG